MPEVQKARPASNSRFEILLPWQARLFRILMALFIILLINSAILWSYTGTPSPPMTYYMMLLFHFGLGFIVVIPFVWYALSHQRRARKMSPNKPAMVFGSATAITTLVCMVIGIVMFLIASVFVRSDGHGGFIHDAVTKGKEWMLYSHRLTAWAIPFLYMLHMKARVWKMAPSPAKRRLQVATTVVLMALLGVLALGYNKPLMASNSDLHLMPVDPYANKSSPFFPSSISTVTGGVLPINLLLSSQQCANCHGDIFKQWNESAHHFSSFNNPWYKASVDYMREIDGPTATQWCGGCHDAAMLLPGLMKMKEKMHLPESHAGVACLVCHGMTKIKDTTGNASYEIAPPPEYPWEGEGNPMLQAVSQFLIRVKPAPHRYAMLKDFHREPQQKSEFCSACHKVSLTEPINNYRYARGFDNWDEFQGSGVSGFSARSFYQPPQSMECGSCHMPMVDSKDFGNKEGKVHSHRFPGANTALPSLKGYPDQLALTEKFLSDGAVTLDLFAAQTGTGQTGNDAKTLVTPLDTADVPVKAGGSFRADLVVRTRKVGHMFPSGTTDAFDIWTSLKVTDAGGKIIYWNGFLDKKDNVDPKAHYFRLVLVDEHSNRINRRNAWARRSTIYNEAIPPGAAKVVRYRVEVPGDAKLPLTMEAHLYYRKFDAYFNKFVFDGHLDPSDPEALKKMVDKGYDDRPWQIDGDKHPKLPVTDMASATVQVGAGAHNETLHPKWPLHERYNDYGIGMLLATDYKTAEWAWEKVTEIKPDYADGYVNVARALQAEGNVDGAVEWLQKALRVDPKFYKAHYFLGVAYKDQGLYEDAVREMEGVSRQFPKDSQVHNQLGRTYFLMGDYEKSIKHYNKTLDIDPEDFAAHQGLMLSYQGKGDDKMAREHEARFKKFRPEETETKHNGPYLLTHPEENREAQPIHEHPSGDWRSAL